MLCSPITHFHLMFDLASAARVCMSRLRNTLSEWRIWAAARRRRAYIALKVTDRRVHRTLYACWCAWEAVQSAEGQRRREEAAEERREQLETALCRYDTLRNAWAAWRLLVLLRRCVITTFRLMLSIADLCTWFLLRDKRQLVVSCRGQPRRVPVVMCQGCLVMCLFTPLTSMSTLIPRYFLFNRLS